MEESPQKIIQNKIYVVVGPPGSGKSLISMYFASLYPIIHSNFDITLNKRIVSNRITNIGQLDNIKYSDDKQIIVLDEGGVNNNARRSSSDSNLEYGKLAMLGRKKNADILMISQLARMSDVYYRELADCIIEMHSWYVSSTKLMFEFTITRNGNVEGSKTIDLFERMNISGYNYNTLESGKIDNKIHRKEEFVLL